MATEGMNSIYKDINWGRGRNVWKCLRTIWYHDCLVQATIWDSTISRVL